MSLGDVVTELGLRAVLEFVLYGITYWPGLLILKCMTLGNLKVAPFSSLGETNKRRIVDFSIWLYQPLRPRMLKMEVACFVGVLFWGGVGMAVYFS